MFFKSMLALLVFGLCIDKAPAVKPDFEYFSAVPPDILTGIVRSLSQKDQIALSATNKNFKRLVRSLITSVSLSRFPSPESLASILAFPNLEKLFGQWFSDTMPEDRLSLKKLDSGWELTMLNGHFILFKTIFESKFLSLITNLFLWISAKEDPNSWIQNLSMFSNLKELKLLSDPLPDFDPSSLMLALGSLKNLKKLEVSQSFLKQQNLEALLKSPTNIQSLCIDAESLDDYENFMSSVLKGQLKEFFIFYPALGKKIIFLDSPTNPSERIGG
ncbi:MAG: F-box protein [Alphaproteobacteria bacterium]